MAQQTLVSIKAPDSKGKPDREGIMKQKFVEVEQLRGVLIQIDSAKLQKDFGFNEEVTYTFVYKNPKKNDNLVMGNMLDNFHIEKSIYYSNKATIVALRGVL